MTLRSQLACRIFIAGLASAQIAAVSGCGGDGFKVPQLPDSAALADGSVDLDGARDAGDGAADDGSSPRPDATQDGATQDGATQDSAIDAMPHLIDSSLIDAQDMTPPTVVSVTPRGGGVSPLTPNISATFSEVLDSNSTFLVTYQTASGAAVSVTGTMTFGGTTASFRPATRLPLNTEITVTLTNNIRDLSGNRLAANYAWTFSTRAGAWSAPTYVESTSDDVDSVRIAGISRDQMVVVWQQNTGGRRRLLASYLSAGSFTPPFDVETDSSKQVETFEIAGNSAGQVLAVWGSSTNMTGYVRMSQFRAGTWTSPVTVSTSTDFVSNDISVAMNASGDAVVGWSQGNNSYAGVRRGGSWSATPGLLDPMSSTRSVRVAINEPGTILVAYQTQTTMPTTTWAPQVMTRALSATSWSMPASLAVPTRTAGSEMSAAVDGLGNMFVAWQLNVTAVSSTSLFEVRAAALQQGASSWQMAGAVSDNATLNVTQPIVLSDGNGGAHLFFKQNSSLRARRFSFTGGLEAKEFVVSDSTGAIANFFVDRDGDRVITAIWGDQNQSKFLSRTWLGSGWEPTATVGSNLEQVALETRIAQFSGQYASAIFMVSTGTRRSAMLSHFE